jgi:hypothetical protein
MSPEKDQSFPRSFEQALAQLSSTHPENLAPMAPADINIASIRASLIEAHHNLNLTEAEKASLGEKQFRDLHSGRGIGVAAVLEARAPLIMELIANVSKDGAKIGGKEGSEGRGTRQFIADTFELITSENPTPEDIQKYCDRVNERVFKGYLKDHDYKKNPVAQEQIRQAFVGVADRTLDLKFASIPAETLDFVWGRVLGKDQFYPSF